MWFDHFLAGYFGRGYRSACGPSYLKPYSSTAML